MRPKYWSTGFTILEALVVIGIVGILLSVLLPALSGAKAHAERLLSLSRAREIHTVINLYADSSDGLYPSVEEGRTYPAMGLTPNGRFSYPYWQIFETWYGVTWDLLPATSDTLENFYSPGVERLGRYGQSPPSFIYSTSFAGRPSLWTKQGEARTRFQQSSRSHEVRFPSNKTLLWDGELGWVRSELERDGIDLAVATPMMMADGSGSERVPSEAAESFRNPILHPRDTHKLHNTPGGVHGRDY